MSPAPQTPCRALWSSAAESQESILEEAAQHLRRGLVVALPTDTVYGLAALPSISTAMDRLYQIKGRPRDKAIALLVASTDAVDAYAIDVPPIARELTRRYWPGGLTLVLRNRADPTTTIALRMPDHPVPLRLIERLGLPLATTSANRSASASPKTADHVLEQLPSGYPLLVDAGACPAGVDSTVLDLTSQPARILRPGAISRQQLETLIGQND